MAAADELAQGSLEEAERFLGLAERRLDGPASVPAGRRGQAQLLLGVVRLLLARQRGNLPAVAEEAQRLQALTEAPDAVPAGLGEELRALALVNLGITEYWGGRLAEAEPHLDQGITLARKIGRPYLEFLALAHRTSIATVRSSLYALAEERARQTIELARRHGWTDEPAAGIAYNTLAAGGIWRWQLEEAADWVRRAERTLRAEADPMTALVIRYLRALLELARGRDREVLATFEAAERLSRLLDAPDWPLMRARGCGCTPWCGWVSLGGPSRTSRKSPSQASPAARYGWPWPHCGSPRVTRARRRSRSRRSSPAPYPSPRRPG